MNIISAYARSGVTAGPLNCAALPHKTVKRVVERAEAGGSTLRACGGHVISTWSPSWRPPESTNLVAGSRRSGRYRSPARPGTVTARAPPPLAARHRFLHPGATSVAVPRPPLLDPPGLRAVRRRPTPATAPPAVGASPGPADSPAPRQTGGRRADSARPAHLTQPLPAVKANPSRHPGPADGGGESDRHHGGICIRQPQLVQLLRSDVPR